MKRTAFQKIVLFIPMLVIYTCADILSTPTPNTAINDYAKILSSETIRTLEQLSRNVYQKTGVALVLATFPSLEGGTIDDITNKLYEKWGIGKKGSDEGVLVCLAMKERKIRIETGYGVEGYITDLLASQIRRNVTARYLSKNQWDQGLSLVMYSLTQLIAQEKRISFEGLLPEGQSAAQIRRHQTKRRVNPLQGIFVFLIILFLLGTRTGRAMLPWILLALMSGSRRSNFGGGGFGGGFGDSGGFGGGMSGGGGSSGGF